MSLFDAVPLAPNDPILGIVEQYNDDERQEKVNLSIGIYTNEVGKVPVLKAVQAAQEFLAVQATPRTYLPMDGIKSYNDAVQKLLFTSDHLLYQEARIATVQSLGGTGALKLGADFLHSFTPTSKVYVSDPTWDNHRAIFQGAGFVVEDYPYFDEVSGGVKFEALCAHFSNMAPQSIVILHTCCHNPTGADLTSQQWRILAEIIKAQQIIPFLDMAYQGFSQGVYEDAEAIRIFAELNIPVFIASSFSKSFSLYGERVGALSVTTATKEEQIRVTSQLKRMVRGNYSTPPTNGAAIVGHVLNDVDLAALWLEELGAMRTRIKTMREKFVILLNQGQTKRDFSFINAQAGMFSYTGLTVDEVARLRDHYGIYIVGTGRVCIAALNEANIEVAANAIIDIL